jgi:deazaflavin-dependent oxidoreductase (nitroreductase family)
VYVREGAGFAVVGSKAGQPTNPAWFHNVMANPDTTVQVGAERTNVHARLATDEEHARVWPQFVAFGYDFYQRLATGRTIPVVILEPR